jgi:hypothetical protein
VASDIVKERADSVIQDYGVMHIVRSEEILCDKITERGIRSARIDTKRNTQDIQLISK